VHLLLALTSGEAREAGALVVHRRVGVEGTPAVIKLAVSDYWQLPG